ncbi:MAG: fused MFS/spermidine synthase [Proteobacteria bacterium]|nr:fused MFS/spermidine synthase [Pseudomonadota bacterium]MBU4120535.1 fused MFS/spermidine synthase [Pseudomonadota bacterium]
MKGGTAIGFILITCLGLVLHPTAGASADDQTLYEGDSIYHHITIRQDGTERCMIFGRQRDLRQTCIDLAKPDESIFEYTAMMFGGFLFRPDAKKVCLIGLGGGYIPAVFRRHLPRVQLQTVEVDPLVEKLARQYFAFSVPPGQALAIDDGRQFLKRNRERYDQIWLDAFNSDYIPAHMTTKEFLALVKVRLTEGGIVIQNIFCWSKFYDAQVATFRTVFAKVFVFEGQKSGSCIIVASDRADIEPKGLPNEARKLGGRIGGIDLRAEIGKCKVPPVVKDAPVLTDDFNPANLLLMQKK